MKAPYILALCEAAQRSSVTFGLATRHGNQNSPFNVDAAKVIHSVVTFSPATESVVTEFFNEFARHLVCAIQVVSYSYLSTCPLLMQS